MKRIIDGKIDPSIKLALEKLASIDLDFYVVGGLLCQFYLKDHARYTKDIDLVFDIDPKIVEQKLKDKFTNIDFCFEEEKDSFYEPNFTCFVRVNGIRGQIEGKKINFFSNIRTELYSYEGIAFTGVCIEYVIAEKIVSALNELSRPFKHLVDLYSFTKIDQSLINKEEIRKYVSLINDQENRFRKEKYILPTQISKKKSFNPPFVIPALQAKYNVSKEEMISSVNEWLKTIY